MAKRRIVGDRVAQTGEELVVAKHKRAQVRVAPVAAPLSLRDSVRYLVSDEELIAPLDPRLVAAE